MPAPPRRLTLFESVTARGRVRRHIDIVCLVFDGGGSMVVPMQDYMQTQRWATGRMASGNMLTDRARFMEQMLTVVSRPGSLVPTRGNPRQLEAIARGMRAAGYDVSEWTLPPDIRNPVRPIDLLRFRSPREAPAPEASQLLELPGASPA